MSRFGYTLLLYLMLPYVLVRLLWRAVRQPAYLRFVGERFGFGMPSAPDLPVVWLHAVSVGETRAAGPLVAAIRERYPGIRILLTHMTPTGREAGEQLFGDGVLRCYLPYDFPWAVRRFLQRFNPRAGVLLETEIWPNLVHACRQRGVPLHLANARMSEKSAAGYTRSGSLMRTSLGELAGVYAQTQSDATRLKALGATAPVVCGNVKFDIDPVPQQLALGERWRASCGERPVFLAASTRDGEEALIINELSRLPPSALIVIVPRHPQRFDAVAALLARSGLRSQRRSENAPIDPAIRVWLGDSMGEMFAYYAACDIAFIGGSLLPYGAHNLIEACAAGKPVLIGPHTYNFSEAVDSAIAAGAARKVADAVDLMRAADALLGDPAARAAAGRAALAFSQTHRGATRRMIDLMRIQP